MTISYRFETPKDFEEEVVLNFDFDDDLPVGATLTGTPVVVITEMTGGDLNPTAISNGTPAFGPTARNLLVPVKDGIPGCKYHIKVVSETTDPLKTLALSGVLTVVAV